jgi:hypothetical protein
VAKTGMICAFVAASGSWGTIKSHVCVDWMVAPSGRLTLIGATASFLLVMGAVTLR